MKFKPDIEKKLEQMDDNDGGIDFDDDDDESIPEIGKPCQQEREREWSHIALQRTMRKTVAKGMLEMTYPMWASSGKTRRSIKVTASDERWIPPQPVSLLRNRIFFGWGRFRWFWWSWKRNSWTHGGTCTTPLLVHSQLFLWSFRARRTLNRFPLNRSKQVRETFSSLSLAAEFSSFRERS